MLMKFNIVGGHNQGDVARLHLAWFSCDLLRGEDECCIWKMKFPACHFAKGCVPYGSRTIGITNAHESHHPTHLRDISDACLNDFFCKLDSRRLFEFAIIGGRLMSVVHHHYLAAMLWSTCQTCALDGAIVLKRWNSERRQGLYAKISSPCLASGAVFRLNRKNLLEVRCDI